MVSSSRLPTESGGNVWAINATAFLLRSSDGRSRPPHRLSALSSVCSYMKLPQEPAIAPATAPLLYLLLGDEFLITNRLRSLLTSCPSLLILSAVNTSRIISERTPFSIPTLPMISSIGCEPNMSNSVKDRPSTGLISSLSDSTRCALSVSYAKSRSARLAASCSIISAGAPS